MSDSKYRRKAEQVVRDWKMIVDKTRLPEDINLSCEEDLVEFIEEALEEMK